MSTQYVRFVGDQPRSETALTGRSAAPWWPGEVRLVPTASARLLYGDSLHHWKRDADFVPPSGKVVLVTASRTITAADNGCTLECTATLTLTVPEGLPPAFSCAVIPSGTTSVARSGAALLNGAGTTLTRADSSNALFAIVGLASAADSYKVSGS